MFTSVVSEIFTPGDRVKCKRMPTLGTVVHIGESLVLVEWDSGIREWSNYIELGIVEYSTVKFPFPVRAAVKLSKAERYGTVVRVTLLSNTCEVEWSNGKREWVEVTELMHANNIYRSPQ
jgi:hypothetical protein